MPEVYKDIDAVIESVVQSGIGKKASKHVPLAVMKEQDSTVKQAYKGVLKQSKPPKIAP